MAEDEKNRKLIAGPNKREPTEEKTGRCEQCGTKVPATLVYGALGIEWDVVEVKVKPHDCKGGQTDADHSNEPHFLWTQLRPGIERVASLIANIEEEHDRARVRFKSVEKDLAGCHREIGDLKRRAESAEQDRDALRKVNLEKFGTTEANELLQLRAEVKKLRSFSAQPSQEESILTGRLQAAEQERNRLAKELAKADMELKSWRGTRTGAEYWKDRADALEQERDRLKETVEDLEGTLKGAASLDGNEVAKLRVERDRLARELETVRAAGNALGEIGIEANRLMMEMGKERDQARAQASTYKMMSRQNLGEAKQKLERVWELEAEVEHWKEEHAIAKSHWKRRAETAEKERDGLKAKLEIHAPEGRSDWQFRHLHPPGPPDSSDIGHISLSVFRIEARVVEAADTSPTIVVGALYASTVVLAEPSAAMRTLLELR